jgi:hypothetical protein
MTHFRDNQAWDEKTFKAQRWSQEKEIKNYIIKEKLWLTTRFQIC